VNAAIIRSSRPIGLLARVPGRGDVPGPNLRAQQPAEQVDALVRFAGVGDGVGEERGRHVVGVARLGQLGGPYAIADGLRRSRSRIVVGERCDVAGALQGGGDPGVHPAGPQPADTGDQRVPDERVNEPDAPGPRLVEQSGDDARVQRVQHAVLV